MSETNERGRGRVLRGVVVSDKADKTITVEITRQVPHKQYGKYIKRRARYAAHDEKNDAKEGDTVAIVESRPMSKRKRFRLQTIVERARI
jgi:small subunit ribosomal protein S17